MSRCKKDVEIELSDGTTVETRIVVDGMQDDLFATGEIAWVIESWSASHDESLDEDQQTELDEKVEEIVFSEAWDFDHAPEVDDDEEEEESIE